MKLVQEFKLKRIDAATGEFSGIAWAYDVTDRDGEAINRGAFTSSVERLRSTGGAVPLLWNHDSDQVIGAIDSLEDTEQGLQVSGRLELSIDKAVEAYALMKSKALSFSVGFGYDPKTVSAVDGVRTYSEVDLIEISLVATPANAGAVVTSVKSAGDCSTVKEFETLVRDVLGLSRRQAKRLASVGFPVLHERDAQNAADEQQQQNIISALKSATQNIIRTGKTL